MVHTVIIVGLLAPLLAAATKILPAGGEIILIEDPALADRDAQQRAMAPPGRKLARWPYSRSATADAWYHLHRNLNVLAVIPSVEYAVTFAARLAERFRVPGASLGAATILRDKALLREATTAAGVRNPASAAVSSLDDVREFAAAHPGPLVLKPTNRQGSVGTTIVRDLAELDRAWAQAHEVEEAAFVAYQRLPLRLQVEEFIEGTEYSVEMLVREETSQFANVTGKLLHPGVRPVELGHLVPADVADTTAAALVDSTAELMRVIGFDTGVVHCEWIVRDGTPYLVECSGRLPGDGIVYLIERAWPIDLINRYVLLMTGGEVDPPPPRPLFGAAALYPTVAPGVVESVAGLDEAAAVPGVYHSGCSVSVGDRVHELRSSWDRVVGAAASAPTAAEALAAAQAAVDKIRVTTV